MIPNPLQSDSTLAIEATDLSKSYGVRPSICALRGVSLQVRAGERVALLGKSGSGKTTLLNVIGGLDRPTSGTVAVAGRRLDRMGPSDLARFRRSTVGVIFQAYNLVPSSSAIQNVELPLLFAGLVRSERRAAARRALEEVGLAARLDHRPCELSGGEQQRVAIARAMVNRPEVLLVDEPTGNLDSETAGEIMSLLDAHVRERGTTLVLVTHDSELARRWTDRVVWIKDGQIATS
jgi:ABC-type lipoprotein export system ATPase subunit